MKINFGDQTPESAGKLLRQFAEATAKYSQNWDAFEAVCVQLIADAFKGGRDSAPQGEAE